MELRSPWRPLAATVLALGTLNACGTDDGSSAPRDGDRVTAECSYPDAGAATRPVEKPPAAADLESRIEATFHLAQGEVTLDLDPSQAPCTVNSFVSLAEQGWFDDSTCHRVTTAGIFVLQCGDPGGDGYGSPGYTIPDELDGTETYPAGTVAMANASVPDSGGSQLFLVHEDTPLPPEYTVFGTVTASGMAVLRGIAAVGTADGSTDGPPATPVTVQEVRLERG